MTASVATLGPNLPEKTVVWISGVQGLCLAVDFGVFCDRILEEQLFGLL
jgi:hypothetical protein